jgi:hypothetical protein
MADPLYVIGIGGTGSKCLESIIQLAAVGLFSEQPIKVLFVDADETNGNLERARNSLGIYQRCYGLLKSGQRDCPWMQTEIKSYLPDLWSPFGKTSLNKNLESFFGYHNLTQNQEALGHLFDVLYTKEEREANLDVGFRGRPAIGSAIVSRLDLDNLQEDPWASLIGQIKADAGSGKSPKILLCGSLFGGTGAAGLPTLGRLLDNKLGEGKDNIRAKVKLACLFVLPYFQFLPPTGEESTQEVYANADQFLLNTEAALRYYRDQNQEFDVVYLLGNQNFSPYRFSIGKNTQRNEPHFIELYAALAARHLLLEPSANRGTVVLTSRQNSQQVRWNDLPDRAAVQAALVNGVRFAYVWLANMLPELDAAQKMGVSNFQKGAPWFAEFFRPAQGIVSKILDRRGESLPDLNSPQEEAAIRTVTDWCRDYLRWLGELHQCEGDEIQLFLHRAFNLDGSLGGESLSELVIGDSRDKGSKAQDTVQRLKEQLDPAALNLAPPKVGTAGLAKALYILCRM